MKRFISLLLCLVMAAALIAGCGKAAATPDAEKTAKEIKNTEQTVKEEPKKEPIKLVFATNEQPILTKDFWKIPSEKFMKENPHITIENIAQPSSNITLWEHLKTLLATGQFPDMMVLNSVADFAPAGALMELQKEDLDIVSLPDIGAYMGKYYLYPYKKMLNGVFYNKKIFADNGLSEPKNYKELIDMSELLKKNNITPFAMGIKDGWPQLCLGDIILTSDLLVTNPNWIADLNEGKVKFNSPEFKKSVEKYVTITKNYSNKNMMSVSYAQMLELFFTGKAAMIPIGSWILGEEQRLKPDFEVGFFPFPGDNDANTLAIYANEGIAISAKTKYPEECKAFAEFFLTDKEWYGQFLKTEMLFATTKESVPYEMSKTRKDIEERIKGLNELPSWSSMPDTNALLPGLQAYFNKFTANLAAGSNIDKELDLYDKEWKIVSESLKK